MTNPAFEELKQTLIADQEQSNRLDCVIRQSKRLVQTTYRNGKLLRLVVNPFDENELLGVYAVYTDPYFIPKSNAKPLTIESEGMQVTLFELNHWLGYIQRYKLDAIIVAATDKVVYNDMPSQQNSGLLDHVFNNRSYLNEFMREMYNNAISIFKYNRDLMLAGIKQRQCIMRYLALGLLAKSLQDNREKTPPIFTATDEAWRWLLVIDDANDIPWEAGQGKAEHLKEIMEVAAIIERGYPYSVSKYHHVSRPPASLQLYLNSVFEHMAKR